MPKKAQRKVFTFHGMQLGLVSVYGLKSIITPRRARHTHWEREEGPASSSQLGQREDSANGLAFCSKIAPSRVSSLCIIICKLRRLCITTFQVYLTELSQLKISLGLIGHTWQDDAPTARIIWLTYETYERARVKWIKLLGIILTQSVMHFSAACDSKSD